MSQNSSCPKCGGILPANAPSGVCPKCLLLAGLAADDGPDSSGSGNLYAATTPQPGRFIPPVPASLTALFPQLEIIEVLGHGGMGAVYKARQSKLDRIVALKIIRPESADDPAFAERFNREARTLARLHHPQIVSVHDFGEVLLPDPQLGGQARPLYYFVMEYVDGANLRQLMESSSIRPDQALAIIRQICEALQFAHDEGIVHRDIKPENVLIDSKGRVKIADFGLAKLAARSAGDFTLTATHQVMGTPHYMAPEQMTGSHHVDHRADIYSLGVVFYELLTGEVPMGQFEPPSKRAAIDSRLDSIVLRALARDPERRFQQASEMKSSVDVISSVSVMQPASTRTPLPRGASTIFEREIANAWHWVAGQPASAADATAQFPTLLALVLAIAGSLMVLLPWMDVTILDLDAADSGSHVAMVDGAMEHRTGVPRVSLASYQTEDAGEPARTVLAQASPSGAAAAGSSLLPGAIELQPGESITLHGSDVWPGLTASAVFACIALLMLMVPPRYLKNWVWNLQIVILAGIAILQTVLFWMEVDGSIVSLQPPVPYDVAPVDEGSSHSAWPASSGDEGRVSTVAFERTSHDFTSGLIQYAYQAGSARVRDVAHRITYRSGFYGSIGLAIALLLLGATGVRRAVAERPEPTGERRGGSPIARVRFAVPVQNNLSQQVLAHFESHGYRVQEQSADRWVFHRGSKMAGLLATDIRVYDTSLTVRTSPAQPGQLWISCLWDVRTLGAIVWGKDIATLEAEGRELELILRSNTPAGPTPGSHESFTTKPFDSAAGASLAAMPIQSAAAMPSSAFLTADAAANLEEVRSELDGPSLALIVVGAMIVIGHLIAIIVTLTLLVPNEDELAPIFIPGVISGLGMLIGGLNLRNLRSRGWAQLGIIAGFIPTGPGFVLALPISIWSMSVFKRPQVPQAFLQQQRERAHLQALAMQTAEGSSSISSKVDVASNLDEVRSELDGPSLALIVVGSMTVIGHIAAIAVAMSNPHEERWAPFFLAGIVSGLGMLIGGLNLRTLRSRSWAQLGIIAGFIPTGAGYVIGLPIAIWSLKVFNRPHIPQAFVQQQRERARLDALPAQPRFSRKAIVAAFWAGLFLLISLPALMMSFVAIPSTEASAEIGKLSIPVILLVASPILLAPIGTTILGCMAIGDIRHSAGRLYGLGLAVADALFFPLVLLNATIFALAMYFNTHALQMGRSSEGLALAAFISLATTVAFGTGISAPIVKSVWKNETRMREEARKA